MEPDRAGRHLQLQTRADILPTVPRELQERRAINEDQRKFNLLGKEGVEMKLFVQICQITSKGIVYGRTFQPLVQRRLIEILHGNYGRSKGGGMKNSRLDMRKLGTRSLALGQKLGDLDRNFKVGSALQTQRKVEERYCSKHVSTMHKELVAASGGACHPISRCDEHVFLMVFDVTNLLV